MAPTKIHLGEIRTTLYLVLEHRIQLGRLQDAGRISAIWEVVAAGRTETCRSLRTRSVKAKVINGDVTGTEEVMEVVVVVVMTVEATMAVEEVVEVEGTVVEGGVGVVGAGADAVLDNESLMQARVYYHVRGHHQYLLLNAIVEIRCFCMRVIATALEDAAA